MQPSSSFLYLIVLFSVYSFSHAAIDVVNKSPSNTISQAQVIRSKSEILWLTLDAGKNGNTLYVKDFKTGSPKYKHQSVVVDDLTGLAQTVNVDSGKTIVAGVNGLGLWSVFRLTEDFKTIRLKKELKSFAYIGKIISVPSGYLVAGVSRDNKPKILSLSSDFLIEESLLSDTTQNGQVTDMFKCADRICVIASYEDATSVIYLYDASLKKIEKMAALNGGAATGSYSASANEISVAHRKNKVVYLQKLNRSLQVLSNEFYIELQGSVSKTNSLFETAKEYALIGANNGKLTVVTFNKNDSRVQSFTDNTAQKKPSSSGYLSQIYGDEIHVRAIVENESAKSPALVTSIHFRWISSLR